jgi:hypothetical protein
MENQRIFGSTKMIFLFSSGHERTDVVNTVGKVRALNAYRHSVRAKLCSALNSCLMLNSGSIDCNDRCTYTALIMR